MNNRKEYMKKYEQEHKEERKKARKKYRETHREQYNEYMRKFKKKKRQEIKKNKELVIKYKIVLDKIKEYVENLLKEEFEITDPDNINYGEKCQRAYFSDSELIKILELLEEIE